ncbi:hypothetical protein [Ferrimonas marina]|uniref:Uncharacterized protein n=1 Tax=Ferrimonas marina TaxID=299255 RepID=A0A1M5Z5G5_9GAMM|nr:hypothetical protein [Ferrimonas marina]SHI19348.1 hypothetical protein SAMN02745129_4662 [Ferrimonas marina]
MHQPETFHLLSQDALDTIKQDLTRRLGVQCLAYVELLQRQAPMEIVEQAYRAVAQYHQALASVQQVLWDKQQAA